MHRSLRLPTLPLLALAMTALLSFAPKAEAATVSVSPADTTVILGSTFTIRIVTDDVADLKAYSLMHRYGPQLQYLGPTAGDILTGNGSPYTVNPVADVAAPADTAWTDCAQLLNSTNGPGVLLYLTFKATTIGDSPITCLNVDFRDSFNQQRLPACLSGIVRVQGPVEVRRSSWGKLKMIAR